MRYLYYIIGIFILATAGFALVSRDKASVEISRPAIVINDRVITQKELKDRMAAKPHDMTEEQYVDSLIMQELLIQEALEQDIHKEESFRRSVESFYEQSLVKILLDRKNSQFIPEVTDAEIEKYKRLCGTEIRLTKRIYKTPEDGGSSFKVQGSKFKTEDSKLEDQGSRLEGGGEPGVESITSPFVFLSDSLRVVLLSLEPGETSPPRQSGDGYVTYRLEQIWPIDDPGPGAGRMDTERIKNLIADQKQGQMYDQWAEKLRQTADIRRHR